MMEREKLIALVTAVQNGKDGAAGELYDAFHDDIYYHILKTVDKDPELAADLTQDTFIEILETIHKLEEPLAFVTWSKQIAYHKCTAYFRKRREILLDEQEDGYSAFDTLEEDRAEFIPDEALDKEDFRDTIRAMISELPEEQRSALLLRYFNEVSVKEIAQIQGVTEGTVKSRLNYARKAIKEAVESYEKKYDIRLHCAGVVPMLLWFFRAYRRAQGVAVTVGSATAVFAAGETAAAATGAAAAAGTAAAGGTAAKTGILGGIKAFAQTLAGKVVAGVTAAAVVVGGTTAVVVAQKEHYELPEIWSGYAGEDWAPADPGTFFRLEIDELRAEACDGTLQVAWPDGEVYKAECVLELFLASEEELVYELSIDLLFLRGFAVGEGNRYFTSVLYLVYDMETDTAYIAADAMDGAGELIRYRVPLARETSADSVLKAGAEKLRCWTGSGSRVCVTDLDGNGEWFDGAEYYESLLAGERFPGYDRMVFVKYEGTEELELWYTNVLWSREDFSVPEQIDGYPVTELGVNALMLDGVTGTVQIPGTVRSIGAHGYYAPGLKEAHIPEGVEHLGVFVFDSCEALERVTLPATLTKVDGGLFPGCSMLTDIEVAPGNPVYHSAGNCLIETQTGVLVAGCKTSVIPDDGSVTAIGRYAFLWSYQMKDFRIPEGVKEIGYGAFMDCSWLERVELPVSMERIDQQAFRFCEQLTEIRYAGTVEQFRAIEGIDWEKTDLQCTVRCADGTLRIG